MGRKHENVLALCIISRHQILGEFTIPPPGRQRPVYHTLLMPDLMMFCRRNDSETISYCNLPFRAEYYDFKVKSSACISPEYRELFPI